MEHTTISLKPGAFVWTPRGGASVIMVVGDDVEVCLDSGGTAWFGVEEVWR